MTGEPAPRVSVVIPVRGAAGPLAACLRALLGGTHPTERLEILVSGAGDDDACRSLVESLAAGLPAGRLRWVVNPDPSGSTPAALNAAIAAAEGEVVVRMDAHARPALDYVSASLRALAESGAWCVGGRMRGRGSTPWGRAVALAQAHPMGAGDAAFRLGGAGEVDTVYLGAWRRRTLLELGGFDPALRRNQDYELSLRLRAAGGRVWLDPRIRSVTETRADAPALIRQYWGYGRGRAATVLRHPRSLRWRQAVPALWTAALAGGVGAALLRPAARPWLAAMIAAYLAGLAWATAGQARVWGGRRTWRLPAVFACMHLAWGGGFWFGLLREGAARMAGR